MTDRLYYRDASLRAFEATVLGVSESAGSVLVELDRTAFYPTSGGQPHDTGTLGDAVVVDVVDVGEVIHHVVEGPPPAVGRSVLARIDEARRVDHTQQHSGQHVLSQAFERVGSHRTVSFHLGADASTIDLDVSRLEPAVARAAEDVANQVVFDDRPVLVHFASPEEIGRFGLRKPTERVGDVRIVDVENFDRSACGGTHVARTGQIGPIVIRRWERRGDTTRVEFVCGWRALRDHVGRLQTTRALAERLSVADHEVRDATFRALDELDRTRDDLIRLRGALLDAEAERLARSAQALPNQPAVRIVRQSFVDRSPEELKQLGLRLIAIAPTVVLLASSGSKTSLLFAQSDGLPYDAARLLREVAPLVGARGGGTKNLGQGGGPASSSVDSALDAAARLL